MILKKERLAISKNKFKKIVWINEILFFLGWMLLLLLGADHPPPKGFIWLVALIVLLDMAQYFYLKKFLLSLHDKSKGLFTQTLLFAVLAGIGVSISMLLLDLNKLFSIGLINVLIWIMVIALVALIYGVCFYLFNTLLLRYIK
jgi:drug/metabolite transporter (DMT)-like permease